MHVERVALSSLERVHDKLGLIGCQNADRVFHARMIQTALRG